VKDEGVAGKRLIEAGDGQPFFIATGITATDGYNSTGRSLIGLYLPFIQSLLCDGRKQLYQVIFQAWHHYFRLRIAHPAVVFYHKGVFPYFYHPDKNEPFIIDLLRRKPVNGGNNDPLGDLLHEGIIGEGHRADGAHAPGIRSFIAFTHTLVVLRRR
jgi:hypothetical protein